MIECTRCKKDKLPTDYYKNKSTLSGLGSVCKDCRSEHNKKYYKPEYRTEFNRLQALQSAVNDKNKEADALQNNRKLVIDMQIKKERIKELMKR